ncbi:MAG: exodeoxyribonuclease-3 [Cyanobacteria bacterium RYN_339]|nr:exodeoxyribonuclease-3 [Cyanobacteria bacterium RYN_339]
MQIVSWNVNGLRACERNGFTPWVEATRPDILCLQEVRAELDQLPEHCARPAGYHAHWNAAQKKGYSGVSTWCKDQPAGAVHGLSHPDFDSEGRVIVTEHDGFALYNIYFPNGSRDHSRVGFKLAFYEHLMATLAARLAKGDGLIVGGDFNTAHQDIDLANPRANAKTTGFLPEERAVLQRFLDLGFHDVFRERNPGAKGHYSWWSNRPGVREKNVGWRIDYFLVSHNLLDRVKDARYLPQVLGSDHCPVVLELG